MREHSDKPIHQIKYAFMGDTRNNMGHSLMIVGCLTGMDVRICGPKKLWPADEYVDIAKKLQEQSGATLTITDDPKKAVAGVDFIHTDVWVSMGEPKEVWKERIDLLLKYQVNMELMKASGNPQVKFMHCLPAFHDTETTLGKQIAETYGIKDGLEVTDEVFESEANVAFEQAENRLHTIKAIMVATVWRSTHSRRRRYQSRKASKLLLNQPNQRAALCLCSWVTGLSRVAHSAGDRISATRIDSTIAETMVTENCR